MARCRGSTLILVLLGHDARHTRFSVPQRTLGPHRISRLLVGARTPGVTLEQKSSCCAREVDIAESAAGSPAFPIASSSNRRAISFAWSRPPYFTELSMATLELRRKLFECTRVCFNPRESLFAHTRRMMIDRGGFGRGIVADATSARRRLNGDHGAVV